MSMQAKVYQNIRNFLSVNLTPKLKSILSNALTFVVTLTKVTCMSSRKNFPSLLNDYHINLKSYNLTKTLHTNFPVIKMKEEDKNKSKIEEDLFMIKIREDSGTIIIDSTIK